MKICQCGRHAFVYFYNINSAAISFSKGWFQYIFNIPNPDTISKSEQINLFNSYNYLSFLTRILYERYLYFKFMSVTIKDFVILSFSIIY